MGERREEIWVRRAVWTEMWRKRAVLDGRALLRAAA